MSSDRDLEYPAIEDHGVIGDLRTAALVCDDGSIDFMCWPRFDSPSVFAALLDAERGGRFSLSPTEPPTRRQQMYLPDTNVLLTRFLSREGVAEIVDFMPPASEFDTQALIRVVRGVRGETHFRLRLAPRFDYGRARVLFESSNGSMIMTPSGGSTTALRLRTPIAVELVDDQLGRPRLEAEITVRSGEELEFVLEPAEVGDDSPFADKRAIDEALDATATYWRNWTASIQYRGRWAATVLRSALVLKLLTSHEFGGIVAAPTFGLPEWIGGPANWDYRYCWTRDTSFAMQALTQLGLHEEAWSLARWLEERCCGDGEDTRIEVLYTPSGAPGPEERALESLSGYRGSTPVRIGNGARDQLQLDITGEFVNALYTHDTHGVSLPHRAWRMVCALLDQLVDRWAEPDHGIWELRGEPRERLHSRVMTWVAFDRGLRLAHGTGRPAEIERWREARDRIYHSIRAQFWDPRAETFVGAAGQTKLDAASLVMPLLGFTSPRDEQWRTTLNSISERLVEDSLVFRLEPGANESRPRATFSLCTFWYVECLSRAERLYEARNVFERMLRHANHLELYAEQLGPCGEHLGNFPQALTHIGLINAAVDLDRRLDAVRAAPRREE